MSVVMVVIVLIPNGSDGMEWPRLATNVDFGFPGAARSRGESGSESEVGSSEDPAVAINERGG